MIKRLGLWLAMTALCLGLAFPAWCGPTLERIKERGILVVGTDPTYPPLTVKAADGSIIGYEIDLARYLAVSLGVKLEIKAIPFVELLPALAQGEVDMAISGITITPKRNAKFMFAGPHLLAGQSVLTSRELALKLKGPASLNKPGITVAVAKDTTSEMVLKDLLPKAEHVVAANQEAALKLLLAGQVQAVVADFPFCAVASFRHRERGIVATEKPFTFEPLGIAMSPEDPLLHNLVQNFILLLQGSGRLEAMQNKWFKNPDWMKLLPSEDLAALRAR